MTQRIVGTVVAIALLLGPAGLVRGNDEAMEQARIAARAWLVLLDGHEFDESWRRAGEMLKGAVAQREFATTMSATLGPLGAVISRSEKSSQYKTTLPGAPDGEYVVLEFDTAFKNKQTAVETVVLKKEPDGLWRVSGYFIL